MLSRKVLNLHQVRERRRKNAITFFGQFYGFLVECVLYFGLMYTMQKDSDINVRMGLLIGLAVEFGIVSVVEVLTSQHLALHLPHNRYIS